MKVEREHIATVIIATAAVLIIVGGFASFSGLAVHAEPLTIEMYKTEFRQGEPLQAVLIISPVTFLSDESIVLYIDNNPVGAIPLKKYIDDKEIEYGLEIKNAGNNNIELINLKNPLSIQLDEFIPSPMAGNHIIRAEFSRGDALAEKGFTTVP
ncbi:hypothetical protein HQ545_06755 [Candidatus Woesearchaeota archaeon]|nr:hypothetical protein [Candidatus Woesearchaeota archaeon]